MRNALCLAMFAAAATVAAAQETKPDIHGQADKMMVSASGKTGSMLVEAPKNAKFTYDKAFVRINEKTKIQRMNGKLVEDAKLGEIKNGVKVSVWFTGPVAESYPVQATAGRILLFPVKQEKE